MRKKFVGVYNPSIILTYISVFCSLFGMCLLKPTDTTETMYWPPVVMILLVIAGVCDMFDGRVARMCKRTEKEKEFGIQLDSLADTVSFVVFPALILMYLSDYSIISIIIACFYVFAGIMRLGWFNITTEENKGFFVGLPVTFAAIIFPILFLILRFINLKFELVIVQAVWTIVAFLFISNFKLKKPNLTFSIIMLIIAIVVIMGLLIL